MKINVWKNWSIGARLICITVIPVVMLLCSGVMYTYLSRHAEVQEEMVERGRIVTSALAESSEYGIISGNLADLERIAKALVQADKSIAEIYILKADKSIVMHVTSPVVQYDGSRTFEAQVKRRMLEVNNLHDEALPHISGTEVVKKVPREETVGYVKVRITPAFLEAKQIARVYVQSAMSFIATLVSLLFALYLIRALHKPIAEAIRALRAVRAGNFAVHLDVNTAGELGELLSSINEMSVSLEEAKRDLENKVLARTKDLEDSRNLAVKADAEKRKLIQTVNSIVEDERKSIAIEIHDELNAVLIGARLSARRILDLNAKAGVDPVNDEIRSNAESILKACAELYASARKLVRRLRPEVLDLLGLQGAVEEMVHDYDASHPHCQFRFHSVGDFSKIQGDLAIAGYRLVQESLSNVVKHANASQVSVSLFVDEQSSRLHISITDNGTGFDPDATNAGIGIIGMKERVHALNGEIDITSTLGEGTALDFRLPL